MRLLLDTHVLLWWADGTHLDRATISQIEEAEQVYISAVVAWEVAIKTALGRFSPERSVSVMATSYGFDQLPMYFTHAEAIASLPFHHRDPFDRMLAAQAIVEGLTIVTRDPVFARYGVEVLRA